MAEILFPVINPVILDLGFLQLRWYSLMYIVGFLGAALGTSLPELIVDITALRRGQRDLAIGDVFGSSLVDATLSIGIGPIVAPTFVDQALGVRGGLVALGAVLFVTVLLGLRRRHTRLTGVVLIGLYLVMTMVIAAGG